MADNLFRGLPPPSAPPPSEKQQQYSSCNTTATKGSSEKLPPPALKSALKRAKPSESQPEAPANEKRLRFKTTTDASEKQVIEAMQKIASHIKNPTKFSKASKLAIQLIQAGSVKPMTSDEFFAILESSMSSLTACNGPLVRADYHALFSAAQDAVEVLDKKQRNQLAVWTIRAVLANDLFTDDSFVFSKASGRIKETIVNLPVATSEDDLEEAAALKDEAKTEGGDNQTDEEKKSSTTTSEGNKKEESDPFGLDALIPRAYEKSKARKDGTVKIQKEEEEEGKRFLKSQREALILCLDIAACRYKTPWCQTVIDILVKHAFDNISRFTMQQRDAIEKLWASIREQQMRRKQGKSVSGKLDVNGFEYLQEKYANEKISIRRAVGASGQRRAEQWLG